MTKIKTLLAGSAAIAALALSAPASADQVILDDLIVNGSICAGLDCVNGESFGFDTLRLKENNLRIRFQDTSVSASFPTNDWQITANDSSNGGLNKFSIDDIDGGRTPFTIEAGAPTHSLYVDSGGRIGLRTKDPVVEAHMVSGDSPTLRLEQDGSSGFTPQTWDVAGNETNFFIRDATNGSELPFRIRPGADQNALFIDSDNEIGLGTASPGADLHVRRADNASLLVQNVSATTGSPATVNVEATLPSVNITSTDAANGKRDLLVLSNRGNPQLVMTNTNNGNTWLWGAGNAVVIEHRTSNTRVFELSATGQLEIPGAIITGGGTCGGAGCDAVFTAAYALPSIEEHAAAMWENGFLPNVGPTIENEPINVSDKVGRMLNELETAHVYIEQLHTRLEAVEAELAELRD